MTKREFDVQHAQEYYNGLSDVEKICLWNDYCDDRNASDDCVYENDDEFFETFFNGKTIDAVRAVCYGEYHYYDTYVKFNAYGNLESSDSLDSLIYDDSDLYDYIVDNKLGEVYFNVVTAEEKINALAELYTEGRDPSDVEEFKAYILSMVDDIDEDSDWEDIIEDYLNKED